MLNASDLLFAPWYRAQARRNVLEADQMMLEAESIMLLLGSRLPPGWRDKFDFVYRQCALPDSLASAGCG
jgi:hypothetical protein